MSVEANTGTGLAEFSGALADTVARVAPSIVGVDDGTRLTASGVIWGADGVIVAASHGVERDEDLAVVTADGTRHPAMLVGRDMDTDIAVLRVEAHDLPAVSPASADIEPRVGQLALALARPGGEAGLAATLGMVSARRDTETAGAAEYILYTDAVLYPGFSGGALVEAGTGTFLGLLNRMYGRGMGVALGAPLVARVVATVLQHGRVPRGYLGVRTQVVALPESLRTAAGSGQESGLLVIGVEPGSGAEQAGLMMGDTLVAIDGQPVGDVQDLRAFLRAGANITIILFRGGVGQQVAATVGAEEARP